MFHHTLDEKVDTAVFFKWYLLAILAGSVNAGGFLAAGMFVTHVTGFSTLFGVNVAEVNLDRALGFLTVPVFFLSGAMISAYLVDRRFHHKTRPFYDVVMLLEFICLLLAGIGGHFHWFGVFGAELNLREDYILLALLCLASGLQNAAVTTASGAAVRTTHLTGLTTDLGIGIVRAFGRRSTSHAHQREVRANWARLGTVFSYTLGSVLGAALFMRFHYLAFLFPASLAFYGLTQARREIIYDL